MSKVLDTNQREQAGSDSYNRFEYQVHWIVYHIIENFKNEKMCTVFCEYHDDMAEYDKDKNYSFFQIKTKEKNNNWTISEMSKKAKNKKSFLGFIFYNFLTFGSECKSCFFISNIDFDSDVKKWQACIEDKKNIKEEDNELYNKIKFRIKDEYKNDKIDNFDNVFDKFIQNTFVSKSNLQLDTYESQTKGEFFDNITKNISMITAQAIYNQLVEDVRKKSKEKVYPPISFRKLIDKKGIDISSIKNQIDSKIIKQNDIGGFYFFLIDKGISNEDVNRILDEKNQHDLKWQNMSMLKYQQIILVLKEVIDNNFERGIDQVYESCVKKLNDNKYEYKIQIDNLRKLRYFIMNMNIVRDNIKERQYRLLIRNLRKQEEKNNEKIIIKKVNSHK